MADIKDLIKEIKKEAQNTRWKSPHSIKSIKDTIVSANEKTAADKETAAETKAAQDAQLTQLTRIADTLNKLYDKGSAASNKNEGGDGSGLFKMIGLGAVAKALGTGLLAGAAGLAAMGAAISAFFGGLVVGDKMLGMATDWMNTDFNFGNIKKAAAGFSSIITEMDAKDFAVLGGIMAASSIGGVKAAMGLGSMGAAISSFFIGILAGNTILAGMDWLGADFDYGAIKKAAKGFTDIIGGMDATQLATLGVIMGGGALAGVLAKNPLDMAKGMASLGAGISGFFIGLATGDKALSWMQSDMSGLSTAIKNFSEAIGGLSGEAQLSLAAMLGAGGVIGVIGKGTNVAAGMTAFGAGIAGFFAGLGAGDAALKWLDVDGSRLATMMKNLAEGLGAFSGREMVALGALLGAGALFGVAGGPAIAGMAALGMTAIGAGLGGFMAGIALGEAGLKLMGADGSTLKTFLVNMAGGLKPLSEIDGSNLIAIGGGLLALGPGLAAFAGAEGLGKLAGMAGDAWDKVTSFFGSGPSTEVKTSPMANLIRGMVDSLKPLNELDGITLTKFGEVGIAIAQLGDGADKIAELDKDDFSSNLRFIAKELLKQAKDFEKISKLYSGMTLDIVPKIASNIDASAQLKDMLTAQGVAEVQLQTSPTSSLSGQSAGIINDPTYRENQREAAIAPIVVNAPTGGNSTSMNSSSNVTYINSKADDDSQLYVVA